MDTEFGADIGEQLAARRAELANALALAREALDAFDDQWGAQNYQWLRDMGYITPAQCAHMMQHD